MFTDNIHQEALAEKDATFMHEQTTTEYFPSADPGPYDLTMEKRSWIAKRCREFKFLVPPDMNIALVDTKPLKRISVSMTGARILVSAKGRCTRNMPFAVSEQVSK